MSISSLLTNLFVDLVVPKIAEGLDEAQLPSIVTTRIKKVVHEKGAALIETGVDSFTKGLDEKTLSLLNERVELIEFAVDAAGYKNVAEMHANGALIPSVMATFQNKRLVLLGPHGEEPRAGQTVMFRDGRLHKYEE